MIDLLVFVMSGDDAEARLNTRVVEAIGSTQESMSLWVEDYERPLFFAMEQFCKGILLCYFPHLSPFIYTFSFVSQVLIER